MSQRLVAWYLLLVIRPLAENPTARFSFTCEKICHTEHYCTSLLRFQLPSLHQLLGYDVGSHASLLPTVREGKSSEYHFLLLRRRLFVRYLSVFLNFLVYATQSASLLGAKVFWKPA